jgi:hypothetical protein
MTPLTIEADITPGMSPKEVTQLATLAEDVGFDRLGICDVPYALSYGKSYRTAVGAHLDGNRRPWLFTAVYRTDSADSCRSATMKPTPFNPETDFAPIPFHLRHCQVAAELKQAGLPWTPHVGCFVWDRDGHITASSPFPPYLLYPQPGTLSANLSERR